MRAVYDFSTRLLSDKQVSDPVYQATANVLGDRGVVELVAVLGYHSLVSMSLNAFNVDMPEGASRPFTGGG